MVLLRDSTNLFIFIYGIGPDHQILPNDVFDWTCLPFFPVLHYQRSLLSALLTCSGFLLSIALLHLLHQSKYCILVHLFLVILFKIPFPTSVSLSVSVLKHVHIQSQTVVWFCFYLTTRGLREFSSLTLNIIFFCWIYTCFFTGHCWKVFALPHLLLDRTRTSPAEMQPQSYSLYSSIYIIYEVNVVLMRTSECHIKPLRLNGKMHLGRLLAWGKGVLRHTWIFLVLTKHGPLRLNIYMNVHLRSTQPVLISTAQNTTITVKLRFINYILVMKSKRKGKATHSGCILKVKCEQS